MNIDFKWGYINHKYYFVVNMILWSTGELKTNFALVLSKPSNKSISCHTILIRYRAWIYKDNNWESDVEYFLADIHMILITSGLRGKKS